MIQNFQNHVLKYDHENHNYFQNIDSKIMFRIVDGNLIFSCVFEHSHDFLMKEFLIMIYFLGI